MSDTVGVAIVELRADIADLKKGMIEAVGSIHGFGTKSIVEGNLIADAIKQAAKSILEFSIKAVQAYAKQEAAITRLNILVGKEATAALRSYADELQKTTGYNDDAVLALEGQLSAYGILPGSIKEATHAAVEYAAISGEDLPAAAAVFGQALRGQSRELGKYGLKLAEGASRSENLAKVTAFLDGRFHDVAETLHKETQGAFDQFKNSAEDLTKAIGEKLAPAFKILSKVVSETMDAITRTLNPEPVLTYHDKVIKAIEDQIAHLKALQLSTPQLAKDYQTQIDALTKALAIQQKQQTAEVKTGGDQRKGVVGDEVNAETALYRKGARDQTAIRAEAESNVRKSEKSTTALFYNEYHERMKAARQSFDAQADYSHALKVRLAEDARSWGTTFAEMTMSIRDQFASGIASMIVNGGKFRDVMKSIGKSVLQTFIEEVIKMMVARWLAAIATMNAASATLSVPGAGGLGAGAAGAGGAGGAMKAIGGSVAAVALTKLAIDKSISMGLSKTGSTIGGILQGPLGAFQGGVIGNVVNSVKKIGKKLFSGGILHEPTLLIGTKSGQTGLAGEEGPEALMSFKDMGLTPNAGRNRLMGSTGIGGGAGEGQFHFHFHGTFIEGNEQKMQQLVRRVVVPEIKRYSQTSTRTPFLPTRGART